MTKSNRIVLHVLFVWERISIQTVLRMSSQDDALKHLHVFVSSTFQDLENHRKAVMESIHSLGFFTDDMIYWPASTSEPETYSRRRVQQSNLLVLIVAHRYGHILEKEGKSITEIEYETALKNNIPVIAFFVENDYAWPPDKIDFENVDKLNSFKSKVKRSHTVKLFSNPDNLARLITEAIALFVSKETGVSVPKFGAEIDLNTIFERDHLEKTPDVSILVGSAEDRLPLILEVKRSQEIAALIKEVNLEMPDITKEFPNKIINDFNILLRSKNGLHQVRMLDGSSRNLYVSRTNLSTLFRSLCYSIIDSCRVMSHSKANEKEAGVAYNYKAITQSQLSLNFDSDLLLGTDVKVSTSHSNINTSLGALSSQGGSNRFLGISLTDDSLYSVGIQNEEWVEWHPFLLESIEPNLSDVYFKVGDTDAKPFVEFSENITRYAVANFSESGKLDDPVYFYVPRQSIGKLCVEISKKVIKYHGERGKVHGDIKPSNILLANNGPVLIDGFDMSEGDVSPGWTPHWSAPEVIMGNPVSFSSDVYSLTKILVDLVGGVLIGEVKKFKAPFMDKIGTYEVDIFYNPSIHIVPQAQSLSKEGIREWKKLLEHGLQFHMKKRIEGNKFISSLQTLLDKYPLKNRTKFQIPNNVCAALLPNGSQSVSRIICDYQMIGESLESSTTSRQNQMIPLEYSTQITHIRTHQEKEKLEIFTGYE